MNRTSIEWTHRPETGGAKGGFTWNPIRAHVKFREKMHDPPLGKRGTFCTRISPGCTNCYASVINKRFGIGLEYTAPNLSRHEFYLDERILQEPLKREKPATIFVGDMFDLFHEAIPDELLIKVYAVMALAQKHTFQVLTKRTDRMMTFKTALGKSIEPLEKAARELGYTLKFEGHGLVSFPFPNEWDGTSVESQKYADERIPLLLKTPAAVRFLSVEPLLETVDVLDYSICQCSNIPCTCTVPGIDWVICGGESGPGARPFNLAWAESLREQCKAANVAFFMKQMGSVPMEEESRWRNRNVMRLLSAKNRHRVPDGFVPLAFRDRKGGYMSEWPEHLRVREFPR